MISVTIVSAINYKHPVLTLRISGKEKEPKPKLFGPDIFGLGGGLPRKGMGAKKFGMSFKARKKPRKTKRFSGISRDFLPGYPGDARKFEKKKFVFNFRPLLTPYEYGKILTGGISLIF